LTLKRRNQTSQPLLIRSTSQVERIPALGELCGDALARDMDRSRGEEYATKKAARALLRKAGIINSRGQLTKPYRPEVSDESEPSALRSWKEPLMRLDPTWSGKLPRFEPRIPLKDASGKPISPWLASTGDSGIEGVSEPGSQIVAMASLLGITKAELIVVLDRIASGSIASEEELSAIRQTLGIKKNEGPAV